jgi:hypothetical protein
VQERRLEFKVPINDPWADWCALQTPQVQQEDPDGRKHYGVGPNFGSGRDDEGCFIYESQEGNEKVYVGCDWVLLAKSALVCMCDATECVADSGTEGFTLTANPDFTQLSNATGLNLFLVE